MQKCEATKSIRCERVRCIFMPKPIDKSICSCTMQKLQKKRGYDLCINDVLFVLTNNFSLQRNFFYQNSILFISASQLLRLFFIKECIWHIMLFFFFFFGFNKKIRRAACLYVYDSFSMFSRFLLCHENRAYLFAFISFMRF